MLSQVKKFLNASSMMNTQQKSAGASSSQGTSAKTVKRQVSYEEAEEVSAFEKGTPLISHVYFYFPFCSVLGSLLHSIVR